MYFTRSYILSMRRSIVAPVTGRSRGAGPYDQSRGQCPSPPWHGALFTTALFVDVIWLLSYTLLDVPALEALGGWNYTGALALFLASGVPTATWRSAPYVRPAGRSRGA